MSDPIVIVESLTRKYDDFVALDKVSIHVSKGEIFGFVGPNGAGKTTLIRILSGIIKADSGKAEVAGFDATTDNLEMKKRINALPESSGYYGWMTAHEYLDYFSRLYQIEDRKNVIHQLLDDVDLIKQANRKIYSFSRGMKQRLGIARSLINSPDVLFLDEPTNGLDPEGRFEIQNMLRRINEQRQTTIFLSTHILDDVEKLCDRLAIINQGTIIRSGTIAEIEGNEKLEQAYLSLTK